MEITESTQERLVIEERQSFLWRMIGVASAFLGGVFAIAEMRPADSWTTLGEWILPLTLGTIIFVVIGGVWLAGTGDIHCSLDKKRDKMSLSRGGFVPLIYGASSAECRLKEISSVIIEDEWEDEVKDDHGRVTMPRHQVYRLTFELKSGQRIPLTLYYGADHQTKAAIAHQIRQFLFFTAYKPRLRRLKPRP